ncbi:hypothetical protein [Nocardia altamirensis]|uniref:hypothetical protein n=1 Tax=Nocardia altamirensis TaxID=472158 RepID=UPI00114CC1A9|nr:hypothetical protein [Nocardia altamirensis]
MKKFRTFGAVCLAAAAISMSGAGLAQAAGETPAAPATGSALLLEGIVKALNGGSGAMCPGGALCPKP